MRRWLWLVIVGLALLNTGVVLGREVLQNRECRITSDQVVIGTLFVLCENLAIDGTINGNVMGGSVRTIINGTVNGNLYLAGGELHLNGVINGSVHYLGIELRVMPNTTDLTNIQHNILAGTLTTDVASATRIGGDVFTLSYEWHIQGDVDGEVNFWGSRLQISGAVAQDVYASVGDPASDSSQVKTIFAPFGFDIAVENPGLYIEKTARIAGILDYNAPTEAQIEGLVEGEKRFQRTVAPLPTLDRPSSFVLVAQQVFTEFSGLLVIGVLGWLIAPNIWQRPLVNLRVRPIPSFSAGLLAFILSFPIVFILALLSILIVLIFVVVQLQGVAIAVGFALALVNIGTIGGFYFVAIYGARVVVGWALGRFLLGSIRTEMPQRNYALLSLVVGVLVLSIAVSLPTIGWVVNALTLFLGLGTILSVAFQYLGRVRETPATPSSPYPPNALRVTLPIIPTMASPAPISSEKPTPPSLSEPKPLGMDNLPDGFNPDKFFMP
jgi:cytoskeletal protein CcmA (bactofilin family)